MSERGQKIFKWIVWIVLVVIIAFSVWGVYQNINNPTISEERVSEIVVEKVGVSDGTLWEGKTAL